MTQIKLRRDTAANWASANSVLAQGEPAVDTTNLGLKVGDGTTAWSNLHFLTGGIPNPNINIVGTALNLPLTWRYTSNPPALQYTSNGNFVDTGGDYWLDQSFDNDNADYSGITEIHFENIGGITDYFQFYHKYEDSLTTIDLGNIAYIDGWFNIGGYSATLTNLSANNLIEITNNFEINNMNGDSLTPIVFPALQKINNSFYVDYNYNVTNSTAPSFPALKTCYTVYMNNNRYSVYPEFTSLESVGWELNFYNNSNQDTTYTAPGFPAITTVPGYLQFNGNDNMEAIPAFTSLVTVGNHIYIYNNNQLLTFPSFPSLQNLANFECYNNPSMTDFDGGAFCPSLKEVRGNVSFGNCALSEAAVDMILARLVTLDGTNGTTSWSNSLDISGGTNSIPSAQGLADIDTLTNRGATINYNS